MEEREYLAVTAKITPRVELHLTGLHATSRTLRQLLPAIRAISDHLTVAARREVVGSNPASQNPKSQAPNPRESPRFNFQKALLLLLKIGDSGFPWNLVIGIWDFAHARQGCLREVSCRVSVRAYA